MENIGVFFIIVVYFVDKVNLKVNFKLFVLDQVFVIFGLGVGLLIIVIFVYIYYVERFYYFCIMFILFIIFFFYEYKKI